MSTTQSTNSQHEDLAIIGVACRFPGHSNDLESFWANLNNGNDCVIDTPKDRWNAEYFVDADKENPGKIKTTRCGFVDSVYEFDYEAFGINKKEAENMDPQQKILLELTLQTFEDARVQYQGSKTGVYVGIGQAEQLELTTSDLESINAYSVTGSALSIASNRISYVFDLRGPSLSVDTACSSAMTAMHMGVQAIRNGECDQAIIAGVNLLMSPSVMIQFSKLGVMSQDGKCKSFSDAADGYVRSEGCGVVLLKPLTKALRDHNHVYAVVKGTALNQDGHQTPSLTLPSGDAQGECFAAACVDAKIDPKDVYFAELHATGTKVGDPVEANSVGKLFGEGRSGKVVDGVVPTEKDILRVGGVKTHVGHLECASYMAGLLKCIAMIQHETLVPNLYCGEGWKLNPSIHFDEYNMRVQSKHEKFDPHQKLMMISSFGFGGANGCSIIQGYKPRANAVDSFANGNGHVDSTPAPAQEIPTGPYLYMLSAATPAALDARIKEVKTLESSYSPYDISYTLATRPLHRNVSIGVGNTIQETLFAPAKKLADESSPIVWVFAGQGPQHPEMGRTLYQRYPVFRAAIDEMDAVYKNVAGESLVHDVGVFGPKKGDPMAVYSLKYTLPSLVFLQTALCDLWRSFGVSPVAVFGHSFGEMAAAYAAGVCDKTQLVTTAYHRARLLARIDGNGVMMAVGCSHEQIQPWLDMEKDKCWIAAFNGPNSITVGGTKDAIERVAAQCAKANMFHRVLKITNAYHTPLMNPCKEEALKTFSETLAGTREPQTPYFSTVTGTWRESQFDAAYTWAGIEGPVMFTAAVKGCLERFGEGTIFQEMSAHPVLSAYLTECGVKNSTVTLHRQQNEQETTLKALAYLKIQGHNIDFGKLFAPHHRPIPLFMSYPFQRQHCQKEDLNHKMMREVPSWRPLAGREIANVTPTFQSKISLKSYAWTADHVVQGPVIFPGAGYIEMCMEVLGSTSVGDITIGRAMIVPNDGNAYRTVRTVCDNDEKKSVKIFSKMDQWDNGPWTQHVAASKAELTASPSMPSWTEGLKSRCSHGDFNQKAVYERFKSVGLQYGPLFQGVTQMLTGDNEAFGVMNVKAIHQNSTKFHVHPALLDATFHVLLGTIRYMYLPFVPTHIRRVQWFVKASEMAETLHVYARAKYGDNSLEGDIVIAEEGGRIVGFVEGMECTALGQTANQRPFQPTIVPQWQPWGPTAAFAPTRSTVWDTVSAPSAGLDAGLSAYAAHFLAEAAKSPKPLPIASLPAQKQQLYATIEQLAAQSKNEKAIAELDSLNTPHESAVVHKLGKGFTDLLVDANGYNKVFNDNTLTDLFSQSSSFKPMISMLVEQVVQLMNDTNRVVHILDVSHGSIALASELIPALSKFPGRVEYVYADGVNKTLAEAKSKFANQSFVDYKALNIDQVWSAQGIDKQSFDVILCNNSLHNAVDPVAAVRSINASLVPNGIVLAVEATHLPAWLSMIYSSGKQFSELNAAQWEAAFQTIGFHSINQQTVPSSINTLFSAQAAPLSVNTAAPALNDDVVVFDAHVAGNDLNALLALAQKDYESRPSKPLEFWVLTSGGEAIAESFNAGTPEPEHATFIGFARTWANEANQHLIRTIDFEVGTPAEERQAWLRTIASMDQSMERELAIRNNSVMVPRFLPYVLPTGDKLASSLSTSDVVAPFRLEVDTIGQISSLRYHSLLSSNGKILDHGEYEVVMEVKASALNFKDLMLALGMLDNPMGLDAKALRFHPPTAMGLEASGVIIAVGSKVTKFTVGDEVFGICDHSLASQVVTHEDFIAKKPAHLTHVEAASLPIVFCTSYSGLIDKARISKGETVLVHSAAGGIGQSSIQLCKSVGADVIATVGNPAKREYLAQRYGVTKFADSHSNAAWKRDVMTLTQNQGVDAVINSLKGEAITYGLDCLRVGGRFVEIGKVDILANNPLPMGALLKDISFLSTHLDIVMGANSSRVSKWMNAISELASTKQITPIVDKVYSARDIEPAFRYLMTGQHMGKVMIDFSAEHLPTSVLPASSVFHANATYMLSGGTGAVGLRVVQWMAEQGARYFILLSRRGESSVRASELAEIRALERFGVHVLIAKADVGSAEDVKAAVALARSQGHPAKCGILHMAMVLEDDVISKQTPARFERSIQPKIAGIRNMVNAFTKSEIEFVISFSSVSSVLGNPAQSNYAAGNGFLDSYSFWLRAQGIKAKTVNLGSIEDVGVLAEDYKLRMILNMKGFAGGLTSAGVCLIIDAMLRDDRYTQFVHGAIDFASCCADYPIMASRFQHLIDWTAVHSAGGASSENTVTLEVLSATIGALLEIPADKVDNKESITRLGLDSLLAVELSSTLKKKFGIVISQMELLGGMSIEDVFNHAQAQA